MHGQIVNSEWTVREQLVNSAWKLSGQIRNSLHTVSVQPPDMLDKGADKCSRISTTDEGNEMSDCLRKLTRRIFWGDGVWCGGVWLVCVRVLA